jgi:hypothetical protein
MTAVTRDTKQNHFIHREHTHRTTIQMAGIENRLAKQKEKSKKRVRPGTTISASCVVAVVSSLSTCTTFGVLHKLHHLVALLRLHAPLIVISVVCSIFPVFTYSNTHFTSTSRSRFHSFTSTNKSTLLQMSITTSSRSFL